MSLLSVLVVEAVNVSEHLMFCVSWPLLDSSTAPDRLRVCTLIRLNGRSARPLPLEWYYCTSGR